MKLAIMQPYFFPYIGYFALINATDKFVIYDDVSYIKNGWINRNRIKIGDKANYMTVAVTNANMNFLINQVRIVNFDIFVSKFLKTIKINYQKAPEFHNILNMLEAIFSVKFGYINQLNLVIIEKVMKYLGIEKDILLSSKIEKDIQLKSQRKVIDICKRLNATEYINLIGGLNLYSKELFKENGIILSFIKVKDISYFQGKSNFIPNLSIIDVMMWNSKDEVKNLLKQYKLV
jgi:hypothetical protein